MSNEIDIKGLDKATLLAGLYNNSKPQGLGFLNADPKPMTRDQAELIIQTQGMNFDYLQGRVIRLILLAIPCLLTVTIVTTARTLQNMLYLPLRADKCLVNSMIAQKNSQQAQLKLLLVQNQAKWRRMFSPWV